MTRDFPIVVCSVLVVVRVLVRGAGAGAGSEVVCMLLVVVVTGFSGSEVLPGVLGEFVGFHMSSNPFTVLLGRVCLYYRHVQCQMVFRVVNPEKQNSPKFHEPWLALSNADNLCYVNIPTVWAFLILEKAPRSACYSRLLLC